MLLVLRDGRRNVHTVDSGAVEDAYEESYFDIVMITSQDPSLSVSATIHMTMPRTLRRHPVILYARARGANRVDGSTNC